MKWAKACDKAQTEGPVSGAAMILATAIVCPDSMAEDKRRLVAMAGACIRHNRKSLDADYGRMDDYPDYIESERLLWLALRRLTHAALQRDEYFQSMDLRRAEAHLRSWWKQQR